jgi:hypothetical protein
MFDKCRFSPKWHITSQGHFLSTVISAHNVKARVYVLINIIDVAIGDHDIYVQAELPRNVQIYQV